MSELFPRVRTEVAPGAVHVPDWLDLAAQRRLVRACREWSAAPAPMRAARTPGGGQMSVQTVCLGWHWSPYRYTRTAVDVDDAPVTPFPDWLGELGREAVAAAHGRPAPDYRPDVALVNYYDDTAKMGLHQDKDERADDPVVSLSLGDSAVFRFGNTENRNRPWTDVELRSGDLFVFGGPSRFAFHGVVRTLPGSCELPIGLPRGRLNITLRVSGLG
ncbi:alpha-ketoglutarate-dependent dioxygenase AlkB [Rhodococcus sp. X156]|uniref:alpha-ketoglutarate-dependent dioxygenase AlkB family protein n=1 Tax=Rhodococcus sp. X156 TaxID=2499145 RepID=UPI000FD92A02|nr:alpha-ketoglutarate-dependent dioxygenase AlkB [Rhodococcus sp. X156]